MTLTSPSKTVAALDRGRLSAGISASATTVYVGPIFKTVSGVRTKQGFDSTAGECIISHGGLQERISFESSSVDATTKVTTLSSCTRGLPFNNTTANFTGGTGRIWPKGAAIAVVDSSSYNQSGVYTNTTQTFTAVQTFGTGGAVRFSGTDTSGLRVKSLTTAERDALTPANGDFIYNSTTGVMNQYISGAWAAIGTDATANGSTTVSGKYEEGTVAEQAAHTATGATGARIVPAIANLVTVAADGTWISGAIPTINTSKFIDGSIGGTGVASPVLGALLIGGGAGLAMTPIGPGTTGQVPISNGTTLAMGLPIPTGMISPYAASSAPTGWLLCDGTAVSRSTYSALFAVTSTNFGVGDGSTTFNLPDLRGRVAVAPDGGQNRITTNNTLGATGGTADGAHTHSMTTDPDNGAGGSNIAYAYGAATGSTSLLPPYQVIQYIIKT